ncbi:MAG: hypothetical protein ACSLE4_01455 [Methyloceanibacter sp.]|uniref:hypothetical protein n=1 Tax=Methyloceanibacter sp. TaxID=1965321 RepID=UPI003EE258E7
MGHVTARTAADRAVKLAAMLGCVALLGGCGGVEFEGKVFDYMGVSGDRQEGDVRMSERPPLLVPPNLQKLPQPIEGVSVAANRQDWPDDPEKVRKRILEDKKAKQAEVEIEADPINPYAGKETLLDKWLGRDKTVEEPVPDVPEPDASDRVPGTSVAQSRPAPHVPEAPLPDQNDDAFRPAAPDSYNSISAGENRNTGF